MTTLAPRAVVVHRRSELEELLERHGTRQQAAFVLRTRGRTLEEVEAHHEAAQAALLAVSQAIPLAWRRGEVERGDLDRFLFAPEDVVVVVGQDGLVANVAKYLDEQPVIGIDPEPGRNAGMLVTHRAAETARLLALAAAGSAADAEARTMVEARTDDGQTLVALNEVYIGHASHQSARYTLAIAGGSRERQSSSGLLVGTGTGTTGWCQSVRRERQSAIDLPAPTGRALWWFVREAWPSPVTGAELTGGLLAEEQSLQLTVESDRLVVFGDGIERDALELTWGQQVTVTAARRRLWLMTG